MLTRAQAVSIARRTGCPAHLLEDAASEAQLAKLQGRDARYGVIDFLRKNNVSRAGISRVGESLEGVDVAGESALEPMRDAAIRYLYFELGLSGYSIARMIHVPERTVYYILTKFGAKGRKPRAYCFCGEKRHAGKDQRVLCALHLRLDNARRSREHRRRKNNIPPSRWMVQMA